MSTIGCEQSEHREHIAREFPFARASLDLWKAEESKFLLETSSSITRLDGKRKLSKILLARSFARIQNLDLLLRHVVELGTLDAVLSGILILLKLLLAINRRVERTLVNRAPGSADNYCLSSTRFELLLLRDKLRMLLGRACLDSESQSFDLGKTLLRFTISSCSVLALPAGPREPSFRTRTSLTLSWLVRRRFLLFCLSS